MVAIISGLLSAGCSVFGIRNEQTPSYTVERVLTSGNSQVELRHYGSRLAADTAVSGSETEARSKGFRILAGYIFGSNNKQHSIDMTAPVAQTQTAEGTWQIRFFMPSQYTAEALPRPNDKAVGIVTVPPQTIAVFRYSGAIDAASVHRAEQHLIQVVTGAGLRPEGEPFSWFYDPPWTLPPLRRNEAAVVLVQPG